MARYKRPKASRPPASARGALPCVILLVLGFGLVFFVFYLSLKGS
jgi:hypothetical protein